MAVSEFDFTDLTPQFVPVKYEGVEYVLREATEAAACRWRNASLQATKLQDGKVVGLGNIADNEPLLVSLCLFEKLVDGKERAVSVDTVRRWPARVVRRLFLKAQEISELNEEEETLPFLEKKKAELEEKIKGLKDGTLESSAKNVPSSTTATST